MDLSDLKTFSVVAQCANLLQAATRLHQTPSAISKALRRLEAGLNVDLSDRSGKQLRLNRHGEHLLERSGALLMHAEQTRASIRGSLHRLHLRVGGPSLLLWRVQAALQRGLFGEGPNNALSLRPMFEDQAMQALMQNELDFAMVSGQAIQDHSKLLHQDFQAKSLGCLTMKLFASNRHPLLAARAARRAQKSQSAISFTTDVVLQNDFACPSHSLICGLRRGVGSDGWRDDALQRKIRYWIDDLQLLLNTVQSGHALAYLPDYVGEEANLVRIELSDCPYLCSEELYLVHARRGLSGAMARILQGVQ